MTEPRTVRVEPLEPALLRQLTRLLHKMKHDLSNSLVAAMGELEVLAGDVSDLETVERLQDVRDKLLRPFLDLRRMAQGLPLSEGGGVRAQDLRQNVETRARELGVTLTWLPGALELLAADAALRPVAAALITNALDASTPNVTVTIAAERFAASSEASLSVTDDGPGCADLQAAATGRVTRVGGAHLGVGLQVAATLLASRGGSLTLADNAPHGVIATARWPLGLSPAAPSDMSLA